MSNQHVLRYSAAVVTLYLMFFAVIAVFDRSWDIVALIVLILLLTATYVYLWRATRDRRTHPSTIRARLQDGLRRGRESGRQE